MEVWGCDGSGGGNWGGLILGCWAGGRLGAVGYGGGGWGWLWGGVWNGGGAEESGWGGGCFGACLDCVSPPPPPPPTCSHCDTPRRKVPGGALQRCRLSRASSGSSQDSISSEGSDAGGYPQRPPHPHHKPPHHKPPHRPPIAPPIAPPFIPPSHNPPLRIPPP